MHQTYDNHKHTWELGTERINGEAEDGLRTRGKNKRINKERLKEGTESGDVYCPTLNLQSSLRG